ncbi:hypothetical protein TH53_02100 [Pedobacter lusitanus]|uniref:Contig7, whole genome shotgun sequence n=2 Tax=Pedobacter lusitanus TaxID=1503925 RepID=A0A0D0GR93_9SPHI|nr:hypothetical protein TH53_02100 [Pedobacter lusitanus]
MLTAILFVIIGAFSFGLLGTFVKLARQDGYDTANITFSQVATGFILILLLNLLARKKKAEDWKFTTGEKVKVALHGVCVGLINIFYFLSIWYGSAGTSIVLLTQSVWMGILLESILTRKFPSPRKIIAAVVILGGTVLATNLLLAGSSIGLAAIGFGLLAAVASTCSIYLSSRVVVNKSPLRRTLFLNMGCLLAVLIIWGPSLLQSFDAAVLWKWGLALALLGMVLPPLMYVKGMPVIGVGLSGIITSLQIPVGAIFACLVLRENINVYQWTGILLIIGAIVWLNIGLLRKTNTQ